jgi:hypothetical protein
VSTERNPASECLQFFCCDALTSSLSPEIANPLQSSKSTFFSANHPGWGANAHVTLHIERDKSFIYRFYADSAANSFIYRFYAKLPGVGVQPVVRPEVCLLRAILSFIVSLPLATLALARFVCDNQAHLRTM